jgi:chromosome partitioning protein
VLFIDVDPQCNLSDNAGVDTTEQDGATIRDVFENPSKTKAEEVITTEPMWQLPNLDIIASHIRLTATELQLVATAGRERILQKWIDRNMNVLGEYDYILIDTNPSMGIVNQNAFMAADKIILVSDVSKKAIQGAQLFSYLWGEACENLDVEDKTSALILNNCDPRIKLTENIKEYYKDDEDFGKIVLDSVIPSRVKIKNTETTYLPINLMAPNSTECEAFRSVVSELKERKVL